MGLIVVAYLAVYLVGGLVGGLLFHRFVLLGFVSAQLGIRSTE